MSEPDTGGGAQDEASGAAATQDRDFGNDFVIREGFPALLRADGKGPLIDGDEPLPEGKFSSWQSALQVENVESILEDCDTVFSARTKEEGAAYSEGVTYFVPSLMKPRCALEALALIIFESHVSKLVKDGKPVMYDPERSGAEWWTLVMDASEEIDASNSTVNEEDEEEEDEVGMHFDADYGLESQLRNMMLHPRVATVTYLSDYGAPTVVLDRRSPSPSDLEKKSLAGSIAKGWLSGPKFGKHICFDGRLLHGAPATFFPGSSHVQTKEPPTKRQKTDQNSAPEGARRVTFLCNVWVNHCPLDAELLDEDVLEHLKTRWDLPNSSKEKSAENKSKKPPFTWNFGTPDVVNKRKLEPFETDPAGSEETVICHREVTVNFNASMTDLHEAARCTAGGSSIELDIRNGVISLDVGDEVETSDDEDGQDADEDNNSGM